MNDTDVPGTLEEAIDGILSLPLWVQLHPDHSLPRWLDSIGYTSWREQIDCARLRAALRERSGIVAAWRRYSEEKTADWGWYFDAGERGTYLIGPRDRSIAPIRFGDQVGACAYFIKQEMESIAGHQ